MALVDNSKQTRNLPNVWSRGEVMSSENPYMWDYWKEKRGVKDAVLCDYPETLKNNFALQNAMIMIENGERIIEQIMNELCEDYDDSE